MKHKKKNWKKIIAAAFTAVICCILFAMPAVAAGNGATDAIHSFNEIIVEVVEAVGALIALIGLVFLAASIPSHDSSQRVIGALTFATGIIIAFAPSILRAVGVSL